MLVLSRRIGERLILRKKNGEKVVITVADIRGRQVRIAIEAPRNIEIIREELETQND